MPRTASPPATQLRSEAISPFTSALVAAISPFSSAFGGFGSQMLSDFAFQFGDLSFDFGNVGFGSQVISAPLQAAYPFLYARHIVSFDAFEFDRRG